MATKKAAKAKTAYKQRPARKSTSNKPKPKSRRGGTGGDPGGGAAGERGWRT